MERSCSNCKWFSEDVRHGKHCESCATLNGWESKKVNTQNVRYDYISPARKHGYTFTMQQLGFRSRYIPDIKNIIFNDPATIVFWSDGTKTVVKCQDGEPYDEEKGLAMAISKKALGNQGNYCNVFKKWLPKEVEIEFDGEEFLKTMKESMNRMLGIKEK